MSIAFIDFHKALPEWTEANMEDYGKKVLPISLGSKIPTIEIINCGVRQECPL